MFLQSMVFFKRGNCFHYLFLLCMFKILVTEAHSLAYITHEAYTRIHWIGNYLMLWHGDGISIPGVSIANRPIRGSSQKVCQIMCDVSVDVSVVKLRFTILISTLSFLFLFCKYKWNWIIGQCRTKIFQN